MRAVAIIGLFWLAACTGVNDGRHEITYEQLMRPSGTEREALHCYAVGRKPFYVLSYGECVSKHGKLVSGPGEIWLEENWRWFQAPGWAKLTHEAYRIGKDLETEGYDTETKEYTAELSRRITAYKKAHPEVIPKPKKKKTRPKSSQRKGVGGDQRTTEVA